MKHLRDWLGRKRCTKQERTQTNSIVKHSSLNQVAWTLSSLSHHYYCLPCKQLTAIPIEGESKYSKLYKNKQFSEASINVCFFRNHTRRLKWKRCKERLHACYACLMLEPDIWKCVCVNFTLWRRNDVNDINHHIAAMLSQCVQCVCGGGRLQDRVVTKRQKRTR